MVKRGRRFEMMTLKELKEVHQSLSDTLDQLRRSL